MRYYCIKFDYSNLAHLWPIKESHVSVSSVVMQAFLGRMSRELPTRQQFPCVPSEVLINEQTELLVSEV